MKLIFKNWKNLNKNISFKYDIETKKLIEELMQAFGKLFDYTKPWSISKLQKICDQENIALPNENEI